MLKLYGLINLEQWSDYIPKDQSEFISSLIQSFQDHSVQNNEFFIPTLAFLKENWFLEPLVCSLRAVTKF